ncbi:MAG: BRO family protein [Pseudohongiella sp.]|uniref:Bro-N domain-containing protein n=1 Tax=Pseudohongiella sp. TaxID=1979412 RepID=UPI00349FFB49
MNTQLMQPHANPFNFDDVQVRTATDDHGEAWFCAKDVFNALEVHWSGSRGLSGMPENWQRVGYLQTPSGIQSAVFISEAGVYQTLFRSRKPKAQQFAEWVCGEVLPSIRKQGFFGTVPAGQRLAFSKQIASLTKDLVKTRDQFQRQILLGELRTLYTLIGQPLPQQNLLGQDTKQQDLNL